MATICVLKDPLEIALKGNGRASEALKCRELMGLKTVKIIRISNTLKKKRENRNDSGHHRIGLMFEVGLKKLRHCQLALVELVVSCKTQQAIVI